ncbi:MAG: hypothetical protein LBT09_16115 [Planctomycetaceae bacterium]|jgi:hypothetical protein|nr:hypothetical protein [Planctomycetaceae bacterium]
MACIYYNVKYKVAPVDQSSNKKTVDVSSDNCANKFQAKSFAGRQPLNFKRNHLQVGNLSPKGGTSNVSKNSFAGW